MFGEGPKISRFEIELSQEQAARLVADGPYGDGEFGAIDATDIEYGSPWHDVLGMSDNMHELIAAAFIAGRLGWCDAGIRLAIRAASILALDHASDSEAAVDRIAVDAAVMREYSLLADEAVAELEHRAARAHRITAQDESLASERRQFHRRQADAAIERAANARSRRQSILADVDAQ